MKAGEATELPEAGVQSPEEAIESRTKEILASFKGEKSEIIPLLQQVQQRFGYLPEPAMKQVAEFVHMPASTVFGTGTFYAQFKLVPTGRNVVRVCRGTACHVRGGARIISEIEKKLGINDGDTTPDLEYSLETVACFGSCALAPVVVVNDRVHGRMTPAQAKNLIEKE
jgi:NADH-quinone oxidoreductase subunit E